MAPAFLFVSPVHVSRLCPFPYAVFFLRPAGPSAGLLSRGEVVEFSLCCFNVRKCRFENSVRKQGFLTGMLYGTAFRSLEKLWDRRSGKPGRTANCKSEMEWHTGVAIMNSKIHTQAVDQLFDAVLCLKNREECYKFFEDLCTVKELLSLSQRLEVAAMLREDKTYLEIGEKTGASTATISRVNRSLSYGEDGYNLVFSRLPKEAEDSGSGDADRK